MSIVRMNSVGASVRASLERLFREDVELLDRLLSYLEPLDLVSVARTNRHIHAEVSAYHRRAFGVEKLLCNFFVNCVGFRKLQLRTGAIISGSTALQLFDRVIYPDADLDVYVERSYALAVARYICQYENYVFEPPNARFPTAEAVLEDGPEEERYSYYWNTGIAKVLDFSRGSRRIQLIVAKRSALEVILDFHSTCVMNFITHNAAYSLFPMLTFGERVSHTFTLHSLTIGGRWASVQQKYKDRGFSFHSVSPGDAGPTSSVRWVGDSKTWTIPLAPVHPALEAPDTAALNAFQMILDSFRGRSIGFEVVTDPSLRFGYTSVKAERDMLCVAWEGQLTARAMAGAMDFDLDRSLCDVMVAYRSGADSSVFGAMLSKDSISSVLVIVGGGRARRGPFPFS